MLSLGFFSTLCEEMKELGSKGACSWQRAVGPAEQSSVKGKLETATLSRLPGPAFPGWKKKICLYH